MPESRTRKFAVIAIACLILSVFFSWGNGRELAKIQSLGDRAYLDQKLAMMSMPFPALLFVTLAFIGFYEGLKKLVRFLLRRFLPPVSAAFRRNQPARPARVSGSDWPNTPGRTTSVTIVTDEPPSSTS